METKDWFVMILVAIVWIAGTAFIFKFGSKENAVLLLSAWGGTCTTFGGIYHWLNIHDDKEKDAE
jgi:hypothetical protein